MIQRGDPDESLVRLSRNLLLSCLALCCLSTLGWMFFWTDDWVQSALPVLGFGALALGLFSIVLGPRPQRWRTVAVVGMLLVGQWWFVESFVLAAIWSVVGFV